MEYSSASEEDLHKTNIEARSYTARNTPKQKAKSERSKSEARFLSFHFPGARQLLFVPLWDAGRDRWLSGCCVWSTEVTRVLSSQLELAFLTAFGNSVMAEYSRIGTEIADQKKGDFIGSISHELRSPLHGILASAEFLSEEVKSAFEKGLVETIDSCGRTLLDTINHILDFSKINHFENNWRKNRRNDKTVAQPKGNPHAMRKSDLPMINLFANVDVAIVCEEVVEGVFAGHVFQNVTAKSFDMVPDARGKMLDNTSTRPAQAAPPDVAVILDIDVHNYQFLTQPGAFRRIVMNLLGNALKYTSKGYVRLVVEATDMDELSASGETEGVPRSMVTISITDTGRGISADFLRTKLFTPFAQENSLSSGTGLGLSIVRSIVTLLEGDLTINSELGQGTQVQVKLPFIRQMQSITEQGSSALSRSVNPGSHEIEDIITSLRAKIVGRKVSMHGFDLKSDDPIALHTSKIFTASIFKILTGWYGLNVVPLSQRPGIIVLNESNPATISKILEHPTIKERLPAMLVLLSHSSRFDRTSAFSAKFPNVAYVSKPIGPLKLARALIQCLQEISSPFTPGHLEPSRPGGNNPNNAYEELSMSPHNLALLDNSRMICSDNARQALETPTPMNVSEKEDGFPFPLEDTAPEVTPSGTPHDSESPPALASSTSLVGRTGQGDAASPSIISNLSSLSRSRLPLTGHSSTRGAKSPSLLLVDDNKINLNLLRMFMHRRTYDFVEEAENGLEAVNKFRQRDEGYDIIFMDISMPVLDGFGATKQIRAIEEIRRHKALEAKNPALIIALTGLASSSDQTRAANVGVDVFLTKPVSFKEVGKLMDNWEANHQSEEPLQ